MHHRKGPPAACALQREIIEGRGSVNCGRDRLRTQRSPIVSAGAVVVAGTWCCWSLGGSDDVGLGVERLGCCFGVGRLRWRRVYLLKGGNSPDPTKLKRPERPTGRRDVWIGGIYYYCFVFGFYRLKGEEEERHGGRARENRQRQLETRMETRSRGRGMWEIYGHPGEAERGRLFVLVRRRIAHMAIV